jgi:hypothetical protein
MEMGMKRLLGLAGMVLAVFLLPGCSSDPRESEIKNALTLFDNAAANLRTVKKEINDAVEVAKKKGNKLTEKDFKAAEDAAKLLRTYGRQLAEGDKSTNSPSVRGLIELYAEGSSDEQKKRLAEKFQGQLSDLIGSIQKAQKDLDEAMVRAEPYAEPAAMKHLRKAITDSREEFRVLSRPH